MKKWIFPLLLGLGFLLGLGITFYPAVSNYLLERNQSVAMQGYIEEQEKVPDEVSEELKEEARAYNKKLRGRDCRTDRSLRSGRFEICDGRLREDARYGWKRADGIS